jgi:O-antigen/teichoic acid export membrane protein
MNSTVLLRTFSSAITWNAFFYVLYQTSFTLRTFLLYRTMPPTDFAIWATLHSTIFLFLLWTDLGLRKSLPRYAPFLHPVRSPLLISIISIQLSLLLCALPLFLYLLTYITQLSLIIALATATYLAEGILLIIKSLYHAYFYNRFFNQLSSIITLIDIATTIIFVITLPTEHVLSALFLAKCFTTIACSTIALYYWPSLSPILDHPTQHQPFPKQPFITYSLAMWSTTLLMSFSERNFLVPFITYSAGIATGNLFKVANDGALFFYRLIIKTIGTADIALLAHAHMYDQTYELHNKNQQNLMQQLVQKLSLQITRLVVPLLGVLVFIIVPLYWWLYYDPSVFHAFFIMTMGYIIETIWIPYERVLEIKQHYLILFIIYSIYTIAISTLFFLFYITLIGFFIFITSIHIVRLVIGILMRYSVYRIYRI